MVDMGLERCSKDDAIATKQTPNGFRLGRKECLESFISRLERGSTGSGDETSSEVRGWT